MKKYMLFLATICAVTGCASQSTTQVPEPSGQNTTIEQGAVVTQTATNLLAVEDYSSENYTAGMASNGVSMSESDVVITSSGTYEFSGDYTSITVNVDKDVDKGTIYLVLDNVNILAQNGTPIHIMEGKEVVILLKEGTTNTVTQTGVTSEDVKKGAIYTSADTVITGGGTLVVKTDYIDGINGRDDLIITGCTVMVEDSLCMFVQTSASLCGWLCD